MLGDPVGLTDPLGYSAFGDIYSGIGTALTEGAKGAMYSIGEAAKDMSNLAIHGDPYVKTALGVAFVSEAIPVLSPGLHSAYQIATTLVLTLSPYSEDLVDFVYGFITETGPPKGWGCLSGGILTAYNEINQILLKQSTSPCEK